MMQVRKDAQLDLDMGMRYDSPCSYLVVQVEDIVPWRAEKGPIAVL